MRGSVTVGLMLGALGCSGAAEPSGVSPTPSVAAAQLHPKPSAGVAASRGGTDRLGQPAPPWGNVAWLDGQPRSLADLRGRVVLIRFWTDTCPFCRASAPALAQLDRDYRDRGVTVIGMYHPKPRGTERTPAQVAEVVGGWGWEFPVALDLDWAILDAYWLASADRRYTSVSFVLDEHGTIRYVHPGPEFHRGGPPDHETCRADEADIRATLDALLAERSAADQPT